MTERDSRASGRRTRAVSHLIVAALLMLSPRGAVAQTRAAALRIDGQINDAVWSRAEPIDTFVQRYPKEGAPPSFRTVARVLCDDDAIYVSITAYDPDPAQIKGYLTRRDVDSASDWLRVYIDSYHDRRTAYSFAVNPAGVKVDTYHFNDTGEDLSWDAVWDVTVHRDGDGWHAAFRIPYSQLRFSSGPDRTLGFAVVRSIGRLDEMSTWPLLSKNASGWVSSFGELSGVVRPGSNQRLEVVPYVVADLTRAPADPDNPLQQNLDSGTTAGVDLKYAVSPGLTLSATVNPDFGQVEADPAVVNLTAFETFFDERRPFFIEGSGNFTVGLPGGSLFYSRRIGRAPRGMPVLSSGEFAARPGQTSILGAGKLTGRVGQFSVGFMAAMTQQEEATIALGAARRHEVIEPQAFYTVSRVRREFSDQSSLGIMLTTTSRALVDPVSFLPSGAVTGGVDANWRIGRQWSLDANWAASSVRGSTGAIGRLQRSTVHAFQRPDASHVDLDPSATALNGHAGSLAFNKIAGERTRFNVNVSFLSPGFDTNDVGYLRRADSIPQSAWFQLRWDEPGKYVRNTRVEFNQFSNHNFGGELLELGYSVSARWELQNRWRAGLGLDHRHSYFDDLLTRGGPGGRRPGDIGTWQYFNTNDSLAVSAGWESSVGRGIRGSYWFNLEPSIAFRPTPALFAEVGLGHSRRVMDAQWIAPVDDEGGHHDLFAQLDQTTTRITTRLNYTVTPSLSLQLYAQPFVSAGAYDGYKELLAPRAEVYDNRYAAFSYAGNDDFNVVSFRTTNVLRWEYRPGSALFVVWQQGREGLSQRGGYNFGRDMGDLFATPASSTLLVKLAYWFNP